MNKKITLSIVIVLIVAAIGYLEYKKPASTASEDVVLNNATSTDGLQFVSDRSAIQKQKDLIFDKAKEINDPTGFINASSTFKLSDVVGKKVILVDFWTYSCINCMRTQPYLNEWYKKYKNQGLEIVGIHTPEFNFEKVYDNVAKAVKDAGIEYPVIMDSNFGTWNAYQNRYWPHKFLIDIDGFVIYDHIGEGGYEETEKKILEALNERSEALGIAAPVNTNDSGPSTVISVDSSKVLSRETYFGASRNEFLGNGMPGKTGVQNFTQATSFAPGALYLGGSWNLSEESAESISPQASINYKYSSKNVYFVASSEQGVKIKVLIDGKSISASQTGEPMNSDGTITIKEDRLYTLIKGNDYGEHTLEIQVQGPGLEAFTFTFG